MPTQISRRQFLKQCGQSASVLAGTTLLSPIVRSISARETEPLDLIQIQGEVAPAVAKAFEVLGGIERFVQPGDLVLLKPNVSFPNLPKWGGTTNPELVKAVAQAVLNAGAKRVIVTDHTMGDSAACFKRTGLEATFADLAEVKLLPIQNENLFQEVAVTNGQALKTVKLAKLLERANVVINLPCAKSHVATEVSFGLKNLMGLIWDRKYFHDNTDLHVAIGELATVIRPHLTILDATRVLVTNGPTGPGKMQELGIILVGTDPLAVDALAVTLANWNNRSLPAQSIKHLNHAANLGVGEIDLDKLNIKKISI